MAPWRSSEDLTERNRLERSQGLLAEASALLAGAIEYEQALVEVARLAVFDFADSCIVEIIDGDTVRTLAIADADPEQEAVLWPTPSSMPLARAVIILP